MLVNALSALYVRTWIRLTSAELLPHDCYLKKTMTDSQTWRYHSLDEQHFGLIRQLWRSWRAFARKLKVQVSNPVKGRSKTLYARLRHGSRPGRDKKVTIDGERLLVYARSFCHAHWLSLKDLEVLLQDHRAWLWFIGFVIRCQSLSAGCVIQDAKSTSTAKPPISNVLVKIGWMKIMSKASRQDCPRGTKPSMLSCRCHRDSLP